MTDKKIVGQELDELKNIVEAYSVLGIKMDMKYSDFLKEIKFSKTEMILKDLFEKLFALIKKKNFNKKFTFEAQILNIYHIYLNKEGTEIEDKSGKNPLIKKATSVLDIFEVILEKIQNNKLYLFDVYQFNNLLNEFYEEYDIEILKPEKTTSIFSKNNSKKSHKIIKNKDKIQNDKEQPIKKEQDVDEKINKKKVSFDEKKDNNPYPSLKDIWKDWDLNINDKPENKLDEKKENKNDDLNKTKKVDKTELQKLIDEINKDMEKTKSSKNTNLNKLEKLTKNKDDLTNNSKLLLSDDALIDEYARSYQELDLYRKYFLVDYKNIKIEFVDKTIGFLVTAAKLIGCTEEDLINREVSGVNDVSIKQEESWNTILSAEMSERNDKIKTILVYLIEKYLKIDKTLKVDKFINTFADFKNENALSSCKDVLQILLSYAQKLKVFEEEPVFEEKLEELGFYEWDGVIDCIKFVTRMVNLLELLESGSFFPPDGGKKGGGGGLINN